MTKTKRPTKAQREGYKRLAQNFMSISYSKVEAPNPEETITTDTGWLSPDGRFYPCQYAWHEGLAGFLLRDEARAAAKRGDYLGRADKLLESRGWIRVECIDKHQWFFLGKLKLDDFSGDGESPEAEATAIQVKLIIDYCIAHKVRLPYWIGRTPNRGEAQWQLTRRKAVRRCSRSWKTRSPGRA